MCWLWTLQIMKCLVIYSDKKGYVINEVLKLIECYKSRIFAILSVPALLFGKQVNTLNYAFID